VAQGDNPAEERQLDHKAVTVKELCQLYPKDFEAGLLLGKGGRSKKATTMVTDTGRINRHIVPLIGTRRVRISSKPISTMLIPLDVAHHSGMISPTVPI
jgi:hypothetical protein